MSLDPSGAAADGSVKRASLHSTQSDFSVSDDEDGSPQPRLRSLSAADRLKALEEARLRVKSDGEYRAAMECMDQVGQSCPLVLLCCADRGIMRHLGVTTRL